MNEQATLNPILSGKLTYQNETQNILIRCMDVLWIWLPAPDLEQERVKKLILESHLELKLNSKTFLWSFIYHLPPRSGCWESKSQGTQHRRKIQLFWGLNMILWNFGKNYEYIQTNIPVWLFCFSSSCRSL